MRPRLIIRRRVKVVEMVFGTSLSGKDISWVVVRFKPRSVMAPKSRIKARAVA